MDSSSKGTAWLYRLVHQALIDVLAHFGVVATFFGDAATVEAPFLCFQRRSCWDVEVGGVKILGSGQRSSRHAVLQHGSLLLAASKYAPEIAGIAQVSHLVPVRDIGQRWAAEIAASGNLHLEKSLLSGEEECRSREIAAQKYASPNWTKRR
jgi:lipoate-protein ligase A